MPPPNPPCPHCNGPTTKHGTTKAGSQRYRCKPCKKVFTPNPGAGGRPAIGNEPMTSTERARASRQRTGMTGNELRDRKKKSQKGT